MNGISLTKLLESDSVANFGWGRNIEDGKAREGMFYVNPGNGGEFCVDKTCDVNQRKLFGNLRKHTTFPFRHSFN